MYLHAQESDSRYQGAEQSLAYLQRPFPKHQNKNETKTKNKSKTKTKKQKQKQKQKMRPEMKTNSTHEIKNEKRK